MSYNKWCINCLKELEFIYDKRIGHSYCSECKKSIGINKEYGRIIEEGFKAKREQELELIKVYLNKIKNQKQMLRQLKDKVEWLSR